jgi:hypothetical protein
MKQIQVAAIWLMVVVTTASVASAGPWKLVWSDEFDDSGFPQKFLIDYVRAYQDSCFGRQ